jgi:hypothetical protein
LTINVGLPSVGPTLGLPVIDVAMQSIDVVQASGTITFSVIGHESGAVAALSSYAWAATAGTLGTPVNAADLSASHVVWTAPPQMTGAMRIVVTLTDDHGATTTSTFVVCECAGEGPVGISAIAACGRSACGQDNILYSCSESGWFKSGQSCAPIDAGVCDADVTDSAGRL